MNYNKQHRLLLRISFLILLPFLLLPSCRECDDWTNPECPNFCIDETDPDCPNFDPCLDKTPVSADFIMYEVVAGLDTFWKKIDSDTIRYARVAFEALEKNANYTWQIGAGVYHTQTVSLLFDEVQQQSPWTSIPVSLTVEKEANSTCFPEDDGRDSLTRFLTIADACSTRLNGEYVGHWEGYPLTDTFSISIEISSDSSIGTLGWDCIAITQIPNLDQEDCLHRSFTATLGYRQMQLDGVGNYPNSCRTSGSRYTGVWLEGDSLFIDYSLKGEHEGDYLFKGIRK